MELGLALQTVYCAFLCWLCILDNLNTIIHTFSNEPAADFCGTEFQIHLSIAAWVKNALLAFICSHVRDQTRLQNDGVWTECYCYCCWSHQDATTASTQYLSLMSLWLWGTSMRRLIHNKELQSPRQQLNELGPNAGKQFSLLPQLWEHQLW